MCSVNIVSICHRKHGLDPLGIGNSLYGLRRLSSEYSEVRGFIQALTVCIAKNKVTMEPQLISKAFNGIRSLKSYHFEVREL